MLTPKVQKFQGFVSISPSQKRILLKALGYDVDAQGYVVYDTRDRKRVVCKYTDSEVEFASASVLPGSTIVINTTPLSLSAYIEEYLEEGHSDE